MKENKQILNEAFFKKKSRKEALNLPEYNPTETKSQGFLAGAYQVTDASEVKRRLAGTFGVAFGNNSVRSMASRAVKQFPILISDNVEPETVVMLKKLMEEQYAEYISLLVSNQVIDLSDYTMGDGEGNIAIQALDTLSGTPSGKSKMADKMSSGKFSPDDIFGNIPLYSLLRENGQLQIDTKNETVNSLLEDAVILPSNYVSNMVDFINENAFDIVDLLEEKSSESDDPTFRKDLRKSTLRRYFLDDLDDEEESSYNKKRLEQDEQRTKRDILSNSRDNIRNQRIFNRDVELDIKRGYYGMEDGKEIYTKLSTADIVIDRKQMDRAINRSVGSILMDKENFAIRDKFEKATFLLQSRRIAGIEYYNYLTLRLGIPVSDSARESLIKNFKISDVRDYGGGRKVDGVFVLTRQDVRAVANNRRLVEPIVSDICKPTLKNVAVSGVVGVAGGAAAYGAATGGILGSGAILTALTPLGLGVIAGAAVGGSAYLITSLVKKFRTRKTSRIEGWERVEALIEAMERQQAEVSTGVKGSISYSSIISDKDDEKINKLHKDIVSDYSKSTEDILTSDSNDYKQSFKTVSDMVDRALREDADPKFGFFTSQLSEAYLDNFNDMLVELSEEVANNKDVMAEILVEKTLTLNTLDKGPNPVSVKYVEKKPGKDVLFTPSSISTRSNFAYGSTEIERKENRDRRYDQPLIMTVKFKERFSDGKFADNELTAVIGILGKVIRIPSEEMQYVLEENAEGNTLDGFFKSDLKNSISDILSTSKISKDLKGMPKSADVWYNLEKVSALAAANKISGRRNNNIANAHIVFSQKEIDAVRNSTGVDYLRDTKKSAALMKRYSALTLMVANDPGQRANIFDDQDGISWNVVPYSALTGKDSGDQLNAALSKLSRL